LIGKNRVDFCRSHQFKKERTVMKTIQDMIDAHPRQSELDSNKLSTCIAECFTCAQVCISCADACLAEDNVKSLTRCIRLNSDCADTCISTGSSLSRLTEAPLDLIESKLQVLVQACNLCGAECERHASHHDHCRICGDACRSCARACNELLSSIS